MARAGEITQDMLLAAAKRNVTLGFASDTPPSLLIVKMTFLVTMAKQEPGLVVRPEVERTLAEALRVLAVRKHRTSKGAMRAELNAALAAHIERLRREVEAI